MPSLPLENDGWRATLDALDVTHVYPLAGRPHVTEGKTGECWCQPRLDVLCRNCEGEPAGCYLCDKGWQTVDAFLPGDTGIVCHNPE